MPEFSISRAEPSGLHDELIGLEGSPRDEDGLERAGEALDESPCERCQLR